MTPCISSKLLAFKSKLVPFYPLASSLHRSSFYSFTHVKVYSWIHFNLSLPAWTSQMLFISDCPLFLFADVNSDQAKAAHVMIGIPFRWEQKPVSTSRIIEKIFKVNPTCRTPVNSPKAVVISQLEMRDTLEQGRWKKAGQAIVITDDEGSRNPLGWWRFRKNRQRKWNYLIKTQLVFICVEIPFLQCASV